MSTNIRKPSLVDNNTSSPPIVSQTETSDNLSSTSTSRGMIMPAGESNEEVSEADNRDAEQQSSSDDVSDISSELSLPFRCLFKTRSGFIFFVQVHDFEEATLTYNIKQDIRDKPSKLVVYKSYKPFVCGSVSRDILDRWVFRYVQVESELVKGPIWAKFNKTWRSMEDHGRDAAFERVRSNLYAAKMLRHFQKALKTRWVTPEKVLKKKSKLLRRTLHATSRGLQVPSAFILHTIGPLRYEPSWLLCEAPVDDNNQRYVHPYSFACTQDAEDPWTHIIHAFIHFAYESSEFKSLIAQLDCDGDGTISSVVCYHKRTSYHSVELGGIIDRVFMLFKGHHKCNIVCHELGLKIFEAEEDTWNQD